MSIRMANASGRAVLVVGDRLVDVEERSRGRFPSDPMGALEAWGALREWGAALDAEDGDALLAGASLGPCVPRPSKVFAVGLNYATHAKESGATLPPAPQVFTKFPSCLTGPEGHVALPSDSVDWEIELVVVIGGGGSGIDERSALDHVAGYCVGQDISERRVQLAGDRPQFSLGKSFDTFGPIGPAVVSLDAFPDPNDLGLSCDVSGQRMQESRTSDLIFSVPRLVSYISGICTLVPGDLIFTGTPAGVGAARRPPKFLRPGDVIVSTIEHIGTMTNRCVAEPLQVSQGFPGST